MTRSERRLLIETSVTGIALTLLIVLLDYSGALFYPEQFLYDLRARYCQAFNPPPTDKLVHVDIDDGSLEAIGNWPWPRSKMAEIIDEINLAGAQAIATDIIYTQPAPYAFDDQAMKAITISVEQESTTATTRPAAPAHTSTSDEFIRIPAINNDEVFARSLARFGKALIPISFNLNERAPDSRVYQALVDELNQDLELSKDVLAQRLQNRAVKSENLSAEIDKNILAALREAMFQRVATTIGDRNPAYEELRERLLPKTNFKIAGSTHLRILTEQRERYLSIRAMRKFARTASADVPQLVSTTADSTAVRQLIEASATTGYVDMVTMSDGIVRTLPLFVNHRGWVFPQLGLALACEALGVRSTDARIYANRIVIPNPGYPDIIIPVHNQVTPRGEYAAFFDIPWFGEAGGDRWMTMYDPARKDPKQHLPIQFIWEAPQIIKRIARNNENADRATAVLAEALGNIALRETVRKSALLDRNDAESRGPVIQAVLKEVVDLGWLPFFDDANRSQLKNESDVTIFESYQVLRTIMTQNRDLVDELKAVRTELHAKLHGRAVIIGWIAVAAIADYVPTSLYPRCPGVVAHGVIFNAIMTNNFWRRVPYFVTLLITASLGLLTTAIVAGLGTWRAFVVTALVAIIYLLFNGFYLFDKNNLIVGVAGPLAVIVFVWAGGTLTRYFRESQLRAHVTSSFSKRVDPALVNYILEHDAKLDGQQRELTVVFTDLAGFTTLSEALREKTVPLLNEYFSRMVPVIRSHKGYLNKFLGDGIMFFFGAPFENPAHVYGAVASVLEMQKVNAEFNQSLTERGLPNLAVRAGISSGMMVVGDAGSADSHDYTVLGDAVNLGARLEAANKVFGSKILLNDRAFELIGDRAILRPIGKIRVVGKTHDVMTYEALSLAETATDADRQLAALTQDVVTAFMNGLFENCLAALTRLETSFGTTKLVLLYRSLCEKYLKEPPAGDFSGQIVLSEK